MRAIDLKGKKVGLLTVIERVENRKGTDGKSRAFWKCKCECGTIKEITSDVLSRNVTTSCGCVSKKRIQQLNYKHGEGNKTTEYRTWSHMKGRCYCKTDGKYKNYGARGIKVCDRWLNSFENFLEDMGRCPIKYSIHRIDNDKDYSPENCRWANDHDQANCKTTTVYLEYNGMKLSMVEWSRKLNYDYKWFHAQLRYKNKTLKDLIDGKLLTSN